MSLAKNWSGGQKTFCWNCGMIYQMMSAVQKICQKCKDRGEPVPFTPNKVPLSVICDVVGIESIER